MLRSSGPLTDTKLIPDSLAIAFANSVLPHPGGPASKIPDARVKPSAANAAGFLTGPLKQSQTQDKICKQSMKLFNSCHK